MKVLSLSGDGKLPKTVELTPMEHEADRYHSHMLDNGHSVTEATRMTMMSFPGLSESFYKDWLNDGVELS